MRGKQDFKKDERIIIAVRNWVETVVINLNLCPFAKREMINKTVLFSVSRAQNDKSLLEDLGKAMTFMDENADVETTLLIVPNMFPEFLDFNQFLGDADDMLMQMKLEGIYQIASFHPHYQFADNTPDDAENYTNKSPFPILHLLRESSLDLAIDAHNDIHSIPIENVKKLREMGLEKMKALLADCFK